MVLTTQPNSAKTKPNVTQPTLTNHATSQHQTNCANCVGQYPAAFKLLPYLVHNGPMTWRPLRFNEVKTGYRDMEEELPCSSNINKLQWNNHPTNTRTNPTVLLFCKSKTLQVLFFIWFILFTSWLNWNLIKHVECQAQPLKTLYGTEKERFLSWAFMWTIWRRKGRRDCITSISYAVWICFSK